VSYADRKQSLLVDLASVQRLAVAFSGGVDSSVLLHAARAVLGDGALGVIADSPSLPRRELEQAREVARWIGARLVVVPTDEGDDPDYVANLGDRCYFCKRTLFGALERVSAAEGIEHLAFGEIADDRFDDRPGVRAAREAGALAPLLTAGFTKRDVRRYAREAGLPVADKPSGACLASRIPVGTPVTPERLARVELAEERLRALGLRQLRVRHHGVRARLEVGADERERAEELRSEIGSVLSEAGFETFELATYQSPESRVQERGPHRPIQGE